MPINKKELQCFLGKINFLRRFISNLSSQTRIFFLLPKLKKNYDFVWQVGHQSVFDDIKSYLINPLVMSSPISIKPLKFYVLTYNDVIRCFFSSRQ